MQWVHLHPQGGEKKFRRNLRGKICKCTSSTPSAPQAEQESILGHFLLGGGDLEVYLVYLDPIDRLLKATTKKGRQLFWGEKCTPDKIPATPMNLTLLILLSQTGTNAFFLQNGGGASDHQYKCLIAKRPLVQPSGWYFIDVQCTQWKVKTMIICRDGQQLIMSSYM